MKKKDDIIKKNNFDRNTLLACLIVFAGIALSCVTMIYGPDILPEYHDKLFHLRRLAALSDTLKSGYFPARMYFIMNQGTGYALPIFYPDLFLYPFAFLYAGGMSLSMAYNLYVLFVNLITGMISYFCLKGFLQGDKLTASVMSFLYTLSIYRLTDVYIRDAAGEYTAMAFLPLVIYGVYRIYEKSGPDSKNTDNPENRLSSLLLDAMFLGFGMAALTSSHILTTIMVSTFLVLTAILLFRRTFTKGVLERLTLSVMLFLCLSAYFLIPFIDLMFADEYLVSASSYTMRGFYPGWRELFECIPSGSGSGIAYDLRMPTQLGIALTVLLAVWFFITALLVLKAIRAKDFSLLKKDKTALGTFLFFLTAIFLLLSSKYFPWERLEARKDYLTKFFCSVQFSWRYLGLASITCVYLGSLLLSSLKRQQKKMALFFGVTLMILALIPAVILQYRACQENRHVFLTKGEEIGLVSDELYFPVDWTRDAVYDTFPLSLGDSHVSACELKNYKWTIHATNPGAESSILFPLVYYKGYTATSGNGTPLQTVKGLDGRVSVILPAGFDDALTLEFKSPWYWRFAEILSLVTFIICMVILIRPICRKQKS